MYLDLFHQESFLKNQGLKLLHHHQLPQHMVSFLWTTLAFSFLILSTPLPQNRKKHMKNKLSWNPEFQARSASDLLYYIGGVISPVQVSNFLLVE